MDKNKTIQTEDIYDDYRDYLEEKAAIEGPSWFEW